MSEKIRVRLRSMAFHHGIRLRTGAVVDLDAEDLLEGRLPAWAEICPETDQEALGRYLNAGDAQQIAADLKRTADREEAQAKEALAKASATKSKAARAAKIAEDAVKRPSK